MGSDSELVQGGASHTLTMAAVTKRFSDTISCFCFNGDKSKLALCPNTDEIWIYAKKGNEWEEECVLREHSQVVTGLDWGAKTNRIVSCSQDRNAYVWTFENGKWKPTLVILRLQRAATYVSWSPKEDKFAVASGAKLVCICYFEDDNNWWVSKHIKKHRSTVLSVQWHPNNVLVATASSDGHARVFSAWTKGVDKRGVVSPIPDPEKRPSTLASVCWTLMPAPLSRTWPGRPRATCWPGWPTTRPSRWPTWRRARRTRRSTS